MKHYTKSLPYELELTSRILHEAMKCFFDENNFPLSQEEFIIIDSIYMYPDIIQMELAKLILKGRAHTGKFLKALENKGFISRMPVKNNSKIVIKIEITKKGFEVYKNVSKTIDEYIIKTSPISNSQINDVVDLLKTIRENAVKRFNIKFD